MSKQLNEEAVINELRGGSGFFKDAKPKPQTVDVYASERPPEPSSDRTVDLPSDKRETKRHAFEIYKDQLRQLQQIKGERLVAGHHLSMSEMVRDALDDYLNSRS